MIISWIIAIGILAGMTDMLSGNRWGLGEKFHQGFELIGSMMLSMAGIMALAPAIANFLKPVVLPVFRAVGIDPGMMGILLGNDMGGWQLAMSLAENRTIGIMAGGITAGMLGGTLIFSIPLGFALTKEEDHPYFSKGILIGISAIPVGSIIAGIFLGLPLPIVLRNNLPVLALSVLIIFGFLFCQNKIIKAMEWFGKIINWIGLIGIGLGSFTRLTGIQIIPHMADILEMMGVVCSVTITMLGMFPILELISRMARPILRKMEKKTWIDEASCSGILFTMASAAPVFSSMKDMNKRGIVINAAWITCCAALFGSQLGLVMSIGQEYVAPYLAGKLGAGVTALALSIILTENMK